MLIGKPEVRQKVVDLEIEFDGNHIQLESKIEILGFIINENLELNDFINGTIRKCYGRLDVLRKLKISSLEVRKALSVSLILSCIDYCNGTIANAPKK